MKLAHKILAALMLLTGCSSAKIEDYADRTPTLDIREYLNGDLEAWGVFVDRAGEAEPRFHVKLKGTWKGNTGTLVEDFTYSDGRKQHREWHITFTDDHHFTATAGDVVGEAKGAQYGNAVNMKYVLHIAEKDVNVNFDDWLYRIDQHTVINRAQMTKFGFKVGELVVSFYKK